MAQSASHIRAHRWLAALAATFLTILITNPLGFIGGGWDDWQYLTAARCWAEYGPCLPRTHWEGRWPVFVPIAGLFTLLGDSRFVLGIWPLACSIAALLLLANIGNRLIGRPAGWLASIILLLTPAFSIQILDPSVEALELALELAGLTAFVQWNLRPNRAWGFAAGLAFGLAFQVRETAIVSALFAVIYALRFKPKASDLAIAAAGFLAPLLFEFLIYWQWTADSLFRRKLSMAHTQIPSSELLGPIDGKHLPFFNRNYIANWRHEPGIHVHWLIDGFVNLFINGKAGFTLALTPLLLWVSRSTIDESKRRESWTCYAVAMAFITILIYALALDPKARIMFVPLSLVALAFSIIVLELWTAGRRLLPAVAVIAHGSLGLWGLWVHQRTDVVESAAAAWIAGHPGEIMIDPNTNRHLALVPGASALPDLDEHKTYLIYNGLSRCQRFIRRANFSGTPVTVAAEAATSNFSLVNKNASGALCLLRMSNQDGDEIRRAIINARADGRYILDGRIYLSPTLRPSS